MKISVVNVTDRVTKSIEMQTVQWITNISKHFSYLFSNVANTLVFLQEIAESIRRLDVLILLGRYFAK